MILICSSVFKVLPVIRFELYNKIDNIFLIKTKSVVSVLAVLKYHFRYQYKMLTCVSGLDYPAHNCRFQIVYELLSIKYNSRLKIKVLTDELVPVYSVEKVFISAAWWECEIWDMFGGCFLPLVLEYFTTTTSILISFNLLPLINGRLY